MVVGQLRFGGAEQATKLRANVRGWFVFGLLAVVLLLAIQPSLAEPDPIGNAGTVVGTVVDPTGAVIPNATIEIRNPVSQFVQTTKSDADGKFTFLNVPFNNYHLTVSAQGFAAGSQDVDVRSTVAVNLNLALTPSASSQEVTVQGEAADLVENEPTFHTDVDRVEMSKIPLESNSSQLSSLVTLTSPGVAADSDGQMHALGEHADSSISLDGQPMTDQTSKIFSNQVPLDAVQSMSVIDGAPPAEYGDKTSLVMDVTTRSGLGVTTPHGEVTASYGSFGSVNSGFDLAYGGQKWGNFVSLSGMNSGRFLDAPEFEVMHDRGNQESEFDRFDYQFNAADALHFNGSYTRSWFQNPNSYDNLNLGAISPYGNAVGPADQRAQIQSFNLAPTFTHLIGNDALLTLAGWVRHDQYNYYPSNDPFADLSPVQSASFGQARNLTNAGIRGDIAYTKGVHNVKAGITYMQTFLNENDTFGIVDPSLNPVCLNADGTPNVNPAVTGTAQCGSTLNPGGSANPTFNPILLPYDLSRGGGYYSFLGHTDVKELGMYIQDSINAGNWNFNLGIRGDVYNGLTKATQAEPRVGLAYNVKRTSTVLRLSYARTMETPYNENLVLSSQGCLYPVLAALVPCVPAPLNPGYRNEYHAGFQQAFGRHLVASWEYIWKYTHPDYDFSDLGNTPIFFPIEWTKSKIPGWAARINVPAWHGFTASVVMSSVTARFFPPQVGGLGVTVGQSGYPFRIDHDEQLNSATHLQYQPWKNGPWVGFNWHYDSGLVAGSAPCYGVLPDNDCPASTTLNGAPAINLAGYTADQEFQAGMYCGSVKAGPFTPLPSPCPVTEFGATLLSLPTPNTQNDDHNPVRIAPRNLFDLALGDDNLFGGDRYKWSASLTVVNLTNKVALYNFLSTFSGTHYVTPRTVTGEIGFHF